MCVHLFSITTIDIFFIHRHISVQDGSSCCIKFRGKEWRWFGCMTTIAVCPCVEIQIFLISCMYLSKSRWLISQGVWVVWMPRGSIRQCYVRDHDNVMGCRQRIELYYVVEVNCRGHQELLQGIQQVGLLEYCEHSNDL